ncbi:hypothetical protein KQX54_013177 [Cotesia glomerata]|uniref:Uncharacterized protein n=1 Tax=Cotesia glomerata TaxID=32391 RepID=A0AAV7HUI0_COTGL|nr:hypothetical protein KQX54_013177 [Cotesia glomerata]
MTSKIRSRYLLQLTCQGIYLLVDVYISKVKFLKKSRFELSKLLELYGNGESKTSEPGEVGSKVDRPEGYEPTVQALVYINTLVTGIKILPVYHGNLTQNNKIELPPKSGFYMAQGVFLNIQQETGNDWTKIMSETINEVYESIIKNFSARGRYSTSQPKIHAKLFNNL